MSKKRHKKCALFFFSIPLSYLDKRDITQDVNIAIVSHRKIYTTEIHSFSFNYNSLFILHRSILDILIFYIPMLRILVFQLSRTEISIRV